jgi:hypothetical protein
MKHKIDQIKFLDKVLLPIFNIGSVIDYGSSVSLKDIKNDTNMLNKLNYVLNDLKDIYPVKEFNLHKSDNKIKTASQAFGILKKCLYIANILFDINDNMVRLIKNNIVLDNYIKSHKMSDIRVFDKQLVKNTNDTETNTVSIVNPIDKNKYGTLTCDILNKNIIRVDNEIFYVPLFTDSDTSGIINLEVGTHILKQNTKCLFIEFNGPGCEQFNDVNYEVMIGGHPYFTGKLLHNKSIYPDIILPFDHIKYHKIIIKLTTNIDPEIYAQIKDSMTIKITNYIPIFRSLINNKLSCEDTQIIIRLKDAHELIIGNGTMSYSKNVLDADSTVLVSHDTVNTNEPKSKLVDVIFESVYNKQSCYTKEQLCNLFTTIINDKHKYLKISDNCCMSELSYVSIAAVVIGFDSSFYNKIFGFTSKYYKLIDNDFIFSQQIFREGDAVSDIVITYDNMITDNVEIEIHQNNKIIKVNTIVDKNKIIITNYDIHNQLNITCKSGTDIVIRMSEQNDFTDIVKHAKLSYNVYYWNDAHRQLLCYEFNENPIATNDFVTIADEAYNKLSSCSDKIKYLHDLDKSKNGPTAIITKMLESDYDLDNNFKSEFIEQRKLSRSITSINENFKIKLNENEVLGNIYFNNEIDIQSINLYICGESRYETLESDTFNALRKLYNMKGIPFHHLLIGVSGAHQQITVSVKYKKTFITSNKDNGLYYDVYKSKNKDESIFHYQTHSYEEYGKSNVKLDMSGRVHMILIKTEPRSKLTNLFFNGYNLDIDTSDSIGGYDVYNFSNSLTCIEEVKNKYLNFNTCENNLGLVFDNDTVKKINICSIGNNITTLKDMMIGQRYSS